MNKANLTACMGGILLCMGLLAADVAPLAAGDVDRFDPTDLMFIGEEKYLVTIASRRAEPLKRAPAAVTVIQGQELRRYRTLAEALRSVPGFYIDRNELKDRIYLRGIPDSFLVMLDGVPFSSDASTIDYPRGMDISLEYLDKIEIIRGPGSSLWGPDAFSGIVNLVPRKGRQLQGAALLTEAGSHDTLATSIEAGIEKNGWDTYVFGNVARTEGFERDLPSASSRSRRVDRFNELYARAGYKDVFEISGRYSRYRDYYTERNFVLQGHERKAFSFVQATVNKTFDDLPSQPSFSLRTWYQYFDSIDNYDTSRYTQHNRQYAAEGRYDQRLFLRHYVTAGVSFRYNDGSKTKFRNDGGRSQTYFPSYSTDLFSAYFQDKWKVTDNLEITGGLRFDDHSEYKRFWSPRLGVNYIFAEYYSLKMLYGRAFRTPSLAVVIEESGLDAERIDSYEIELGFHYHHLFAFTANYFYNDIKDLIERDAAGKITNRGSANLKGIELSARWQPVRRLALYAFYSRLFSNSQRGARIRQSIQTGGDPVQTVETTVENFFNVAPDSVASAGFDVDLLRDRVRLNMEFSYAGKRRLVRGDDDLYRGRRRLGSYIIADLNLFLYDVPVKNVDITVRVRNLFNRSYYTRGAFGLVDAQDCSGYIMLRYRF